MEENNIKILGARVHNLQNVDLEIPCGKLVVITGLSGSGKSSLAFDTIYAEGQRRYMETLSTYARQFVGTMERPDVDKITGLSPVVAIEQKTTNKNPRSTVGTVTEISDFLRLLYARASRAYSPVTGEEMVHYTDEQIVELILKEFDGRKIAVTAPIVKGRKGHYRELFESLIKKGYLYARIDGEIREFTPGMKLDRYKIHTIDLVIDRMAVGDSLRERLLTSLCEAMRQGKGTMAVYDYETEAQESLYDLSAVDTKTPYDLYLQGSKSLLHIDSPLSATDKTLVVFRDSFGSSLIPLLAESYRTIYAVDIRYRPSQLLGRYLTFDGSEDVLFLYSVMVLQNSLTMT